MRDNIEQAQEKALRRLVYEEQQREAAEQKAAERAAEAERAAQKQSQLVAEAEAARILADLKPAYGRRNKAAAKLAEVLAEFMAAESEIRAGMGRAEEITRPYFQYLDNYLLAERRAAVRGNSGLPDHADFALPHDQAGDLAYTVARGFASGIIIPGGIRLPSGGTVAIKR